ncbi:hypothetical protein XNC3_860011 [Xenorhabdus nematophila F1]|nr:hypothetical protein XNC3_860011 [Xenorhabdus nematophila F1]
MILSEMEIIILAMKIFITSEQKIKLERLHGQCRVNGSKFAKVVLPII